MNRNQLIDIVRQSAHQFHNPDSIFGYGIPNFEIAYRDVLKSLKQESDSVTTDLITVRKTEGNFLIITLNEPEYQSQSYTLRILDEKGYSIITEFFESSDIVFELTDQVRNNNVELYIVTQSPFAQHTVRYKI